MKERDVSYVDNETSKPKITIAAKTSTETTTAIKIDQTNANDKIDSIPMAKYHSITAAFDIRQYLEIAAVSVENICSHIQHPATPTSKK